MRGAIDQQPTLALQVFPGVAVAVDQAADLRQRQSDLPVHQDPLRAFQVGVDVEPVAAERPPRRHQQVDRLPMPQRPHGDPEQLGGLADGQLGAVAVAGAVGGRNRFISHERDSIT